jgi:beta-glucosidase
VALMKGMGLKAYRFSIAWPRLLPRGRGRINEAGLDFYDRLIDGLLEAGIEPWACLYHWDLPQALDDIGGWPERDSAGWFADYAVLAARRYGDRVKHWATFNEFSVFTLFGWAWGWGAPSVADRALYLRTVHHVNLAHGAAIDVLRDLVPGAQVGGIHSWQPCRPEADTPEAREAAELFNEHWNLVFPDAQILGRYPPLLAPAIEPYVQAGDMARICRPLDWFGVNHYAPVYARPAPDLTTKSIFGILPEGTQTSGVGWPVDPSAFTETLLTLTKRYRLPVYVTENGYGMKSGDEPGPDGEIDDAPRLEYLKAYLAAMEQAKREGADVRGYFVWSLLDNFEWGGGYGSRFGIVHVDFTTQKRTLKRSGNWYAGVVGGGAVG